jgi:small multidrug resistance pump
MEWLILALAIVCEVGGTTSMKLTEGFTKPVFIIPLVLCYAASLGLLTLALRKIDIGTAYAVWSGLGTALIALVGFVAFRDAVTVLKLVSLGLIIIGVAGLRLAGANA